MSEKDYVIPPYTKIKQAAIFDVKELYHMMFYWFDRHGYEFQEKEYKEKIKVDSKDIEIKWQAQRKINDYIMFVIEINFFGLGMRPVEIEKEGKKVKTTSIELELRISAHILKDYEETWSQKPIAKFLRGIYDKFILGSKIEQYEDDLYEETYNLINEIKTFLNLHKF